MKSYLGLGKTLYSSSACLITLDNEDLRIENILNERVTRKKANGGWPESPLLELAPKLDISSIKICESRDVITARTKEDALNNSIPFYEYLEKKGLENFTTKYNDKIDVIPHHLAHAYCGLAMSPYEKSLIVVIDGAGSRLDDFKDRWEAHIDSTSLSSNEECTLFLQNGVTISEATKYWHSFTEKDSFSEGIGILYEKAAEYIFGSNQASGKVMGLASFGTPIEIDSYVEYLTSLDWSKAFGGGSKDEWENSPNMELYKNIAATVQLAFEKHLNRILLRAKQDYPDYDNLILVGGCALNCSYNSKLVAQKLFKNIYVPPFPGDSGIGLGTAHYLLYNDDPSRWRPKPHNDQHGYYGPESSLPEADKVREVFGSFKISRPDNILTFTSELLEDGKIIAWFQGRSESGPRSLGNRSILASVTRRDLKSYLNKKIKFRESFRPYGCSTIDTHASTYFDVPHDFCNPYMSFATSVNDEFKDCFKEVSHIDGTSRMQIVSEGQNKKFYELIKTHGERTGIFCLANTSLNVMGEPIVESIEDAKHFLMNTNIDGLVIGDYFVTR